MIISKNSKIAIYIIILVLVISSASYIFYVKTKLLSEPPACGNDMFERMEVVQKPEVKKELVNSNGIIEGSISYPGGRFPDDLKICAESVETKKQYCTSEQITDEKYLYNKGYSLEVPEGSYTVFAIDHRDIEAYYTKYIKCRVENKCDRIMGTDIARCKSLCGERIAEVETVVVKKDQALSNIDPIEWYINNQ